MTTVSHDDKIAQIDPEIMDRIRRLLAKSRRIELVFDGIAVEVPPRCARKFRWPCRKNLMEIGKSPLRNLPIC